MHLTASSGKLCRGFLVTPQGEKLYKIVTTDDGRWTTVSRVDAPMVTSDTASEVTLIDSKSKGCTELAKFCWSNLGLSTVSAGLGDLLTRLGDEAANRELNFTGSNDQNYKWNWGLLGFGPLTLSHEKCKTPIARFHSSKGLLKPTKPFLEVSDDEISLNDLDAIIASLVYAEKKRRPVQDDHHGSAREMRCASTAMYMASRA